MTVATRRAPVGRGAGEYARMGLESQIAAASREQIITLLFDGAENSIKQARIHIQSNDIAGKGNAISRAIDIINQGLVSALDAEKGGEIAENLAALYDYVCRKLIEANRTNSLETLDEAEKILGRVSSAWREMAAAQGAS